MSSRRAAAAIGRSRAAVFAPGERPRSRRGGAPGLSASGSLPATFASPPRAPRSAPRPPPSPCAGFAPPPPVARRRVRRLGARGRPARRRLPSPAPTPPFARSRRGAGRAGARGLRRAGARSLYRAGKPSPPPVRALAPRSPAAKGGTASALSTAWLFRCAASFERSRARSRCFRPPAAEGLAGRGSRAAQVGLPVRGPRVVARRAQAGAGRSRRGRWRGRRWGAGRGGGGDGEGAGRGGVARRRRSIL